MIRPHHFDAYWQRVEAELAALPIAPEEELLPLRSTAGCDCYSVRLTGIGPYRLFAYMSIPRGGGPFPALYQVPRIQSVVEVLTQGDPQSRRARYVTFSLAFRGQRNAERPYEAAFPGILTDGIHDPERYVFRGIAADVLRGFDYLFTRPEVDRRRILAVGANDLALLLAGMRPGVTHAVTTPGPFFQARELTAATDEYPIEELNDYLRTDADGEEQLFRTLSYFDPRHVSRRILAPCLLWAGPDGSPREASALRALTGGAANFEVRATECSRYRDGKYQEDWITRQLGFETPLYPEAWM